MSTASQHHVHDGETFIDRRPPSCTKNPRGRLKASSETGGETMIKRLSGVLLGLVVAAGIMLATAPSAHATAPATLCIGNWVNAPCVRPVPQAKPVAKRIIVRAEPARRQLHRQEPLVQRKLIRLAARTAKVCIGNWVNAACAAP